MLGSSDRAGTATSEFCSMWGPVSRPPDSRPMMFEDPHSIVVLQLYRRLSSAQCSTRWACASVLLMAACGAGGADETVIDTGVPGMVQAALSRHGRDRVAALGELLFNDTNLSSPAGQACATCHVAELAFTDPDADVPTSQGVLADRFGVRNSPMAAYASFVPPLHIDPEEGLFVGGLFLDGRVDTLEEQAAKPFLNPLEMNNADQAEVVAKLRRAPYRGLFEQVYGRRALEQVE